MVLSGDKVGIGTTVPSQPLTVAGNISASGDFHGLNGTLTLGGNISGSATSTGSFGQGHFADKLGVGTQSPATIWGKNLQIASSGTNSAGALILSNISDSISDNTTVGAISFTAGSSYNRISEITSIADGTSENAGDLLFKTMTGGSLSTRMTILSSGKVGIGTTSPSRTLHLYESDQAEVLMTTSGASLGGLLYYNDSETKFLAVANKAHKIDAIEDLTSCLDITDSSIRDLINDTIKYYDNGIY